MSTHRNKNAVSDVVLLHGWAFNSHVWDGLIELATRQNPDRWRFHALEIAVAESDNLDALVQKVLSQVPQKAIYMGWSMGGLLALAIAVAYPERVQALCMVSSTPCFLEQDASGWRGVTIDAFDRFYSAVANDAQKALREFIYFGLATRVDQKQYYRNVEALLFKYGTPSVASLLTGLSILKNSDFRSRLGSFDASDSSWCLCCGDQDPLTPVPVSLTPIVVSGAGHMLPITHPEVLLKILVENIK